MLTSVKLKSDDKQLHLSGLRGYIRQEPNSKWLSVAKVPLGIYCMSGTDSTRLFNRFMHRIGEAPVIYDEDLTNYSRRALTGALRSQGYLHAVVTTDTTQRGKRSKLTYTLNGGRRYYVGNIVYNYADETLRRIVEDAGPYKLYKGMPLDMNMLDEERTRIIGVLRQNGYFNVNSEFITFDADTIAGAYDVSLRLTLQAPAGSNPQIAFQRYRLGSIRIHEMPHEALSDSARTASTVRFHGLDIISSGRRRLSNSVYRREVFLYNDSLFDDRSTRHTYQGLNALPIINYATVHYSQPQEGDSVLHADIYTHLNKPNSASFDIEGTNTAGDLGGAASLTYTNRNLFGSSESLSIKFRGAYEAIHNLEGYQNQNYIEYGADATLGLASMPFFIREERQRKVKGNSEISLLYNSQDRPEFHRRLVTGTWSINWHRRSTPGWRNRVDIVSLNYVFMPWISDTFTKEYLEGDDPRYAVLRYSYENLFIMKTGYNFTYNSLHAGTPGGTLNKTNGYQIKFNIETAGNLLYGISHISRMKPDASGQYSLFNIPYSQYARIDFDFSKSLLFSERHALAFHTAFGLAVPYGNSTIVPYEKRYFSGGANSVRGWSVRQLGPGSYEGKDGNIDFINQTGNLKLDLSVEYRTSLFWKFEGAAFIDAGNIWNTRNYADQPGGYFRWSTFYKQIAVSYGIGLRLNFNYFILRLDGGMKAVNPTVPSGPGHWPIVHPNFKRDFALHFAVGLPF